ncbi:MAG: ROK family protein [Parcubacteria group bacterium]|jgi:glucokinase
MKIICFDIGGTKILKAVVEIAGDKFKFLEVEEEKNPRKEKAIREVLLSYSQTARDAFKTKKIAISTSDIVDPSKKTIGESMPCFGVNTFSWKFLEKGGFSVRAENDGRCFSLGEYYFGQGKGKQSVLTLTLGTGIGGGFIIKGENYRGVHFSALEVGRSKVYFEKNWHQWEQLAAGRGIEKFYAILGGKKITAKEVFERAKKGELAAKKVLVQAEDVLGVGISNLLNILDPEVLIFGGGISEQKQFVKRAISIAQKNCINKKANYKFAISSLGNKANLLGAASLYF